MINRVTREYCDMAETALDVAIKPGNEQPDGLEASCVRELETEASHVFVDARFMRDDRSTQAIPDRSCVRGKYVMHFDAQNFDQSAGAHLLFLRVGPETDGGRPFELALKRSDWMDRPSDEVAVPACPTAHGLLRRSTGGWTALVTPAAHPQRRTRQASELSPSPVSQAPE